MILMEKDGVKKFVFDCFVSQYRADGWKAEGEEDLGQNSPPVDPDNAGDDGVVPTGTDADGDDEGNATVDDETAVANAPVDPDNAGDDGVVPAAKFRCPYCDKEYDKEASLKTHIRRSHAEQ